MKKFPAIKLAQAPLLMNFLEKIIVFSEDIHLDTDFANELSIVGICECGQSDCATVSCRFTQKWDKNLLGSRLVNTSKGIVILHFLEDGFFELEALEYEHYPYRSELQRILHKNYTTPSDRELLELENYFSDLKDEEMQVVVIEGIE